MLRMCDHLCAPIQKSETIPLWQTVVRRLCVDSRAAQGASLPWRIDAPLECKFYDALTAMETHFCSMEQVDKLAFPCPSGLS